MDRFALDFRMDKTLTVYVSSLLGGFLTDKERLIALEWGEWSVWVALAILAFIRRECVLAWGHFYNAGRLPNPGPGEYSWPPDMVTTGPTVERPKLALYGVCRAFLAYQPAERLSMEDGDYRIYYGVEQKKWIEEKLKAGSGIDFSEGKNNDPVLVSEAPIVEVKDVVALPVLREVKSTGRKTVARLKGGEKEVWTCGKGKGADKLTLKWDAKREMFTVSGKVGGKEVLTRFTNIKSARAFVKESMSNETVRQGEEAAAQDRGHEGCVTPADQRE